MCGISLHTCSISKTLQQDFNFRRSHANYMFPLEWNESCFCAMYLASVLGSTKTKCRFWKVRSSCCGHKMCSCAHPHDSCEFLINTKEPNPSQTHPDSPQGWAASLPHPLIAPDVNLHDRLFCSLVSTHTILLNQMCIRTVPANSTGDFF